MRIDSSPVRPSESLEANPAVTHSLDGKYLGKTFRERRGWSALYEPEPGERRKADADTYEGAVDALVALAAEWGAIAEDDAADWAAIRREEAAR